MSFPSLVHLPVDELERPEERPEECTPHGISPHHIGELEEYHYLWTWLRYEEVLEGKVSSKSEWAVEWKDGHVCYMHALDQPNDVHAVRLQLRQSPPTLLCNDGRTDPFEHIVVWGDVESVLAAAAAYYVARTALWRRVWSRHLPLDPLAQTKALRALTGAPSDATRRAIRYYAGFLFNCIREAQSDPLGEKGCLGKTAMELREYVRLIKAAMVELPFDVHVASIVDFEMLSHIDFQQTATRAVPSFLSTTFNLRGVEKGVFDKFAEGKPLCMALRLQRGVRVLPIFALKEQWDPWEYELLVDGDQMMRTEGGVRTERSYCGRDFSVTNVEIWPFG